MAKAQKPKTGKKSSVRIHMSKVIRPSLLAELRQMIESARGRAASLVNIELVLLYWRIGRRVRHEVLKEQRAAYGEQIVSALSRQLTLEYGPGFSEKSLRHMIRFAEVFQEESFASTLPGELGWSHILEIMYLPDPLRRQFYIEMCRIERWSVRTLRQRIGTLLFECTAISEQPVKVIEDDLQRLKNRDHLTSELVFRDPYFLDFLGLHGEYSEKDIESAILRELERFILELGTDFAFISRQKRISVDSEDYYLDLLFYHRRLRRLVAIDFELERFQASHKGQMELYLRWLDKHDRQKGEERPIGLILCAGKSAEQIELLESEKAGIRVAEYMIELPPRELLKRKLHDAIRIARQRLDFKKI